MDQVPRLHEDEGAVVAPAVILLRALPRGVAEAGALAEDVQIGHREIKGTVGAAGEVWVAHALLLGEELAVEDGLAAVDVGEGGAVAADGKVGGVRLVLEIDHHIAGEVLFAERAGRPRKGADDLNAGGFLDPWRRGRGLREARRRANQQECADCKDAARGNETKETVHGGREGGG